MLPRILGFCGAAGVGKSQAAEAVENACGHERTSFGAWLRDIAVACYDVDAGRLGDLKVKVRGGAVLTEDERNEMLWIRSELRRIGAGMKAIDRSCFTRPAMLFADQGITPRGPVQRTLRKEKDGLWYAKIVVDDVRWIEEIQAIKKRGGAVVRYRGRERELGLKDANVFLPFERKLNVCRDTKREWPDIREARRLLNERFDSEPVEVFA